MAVPPGMRTAKPVERPPFVLGKTPRVISDLEQGHAQVEMGLRVIRLQSDSPFTISNCSIGFAQAAGDISQTVISLGVFIFGFDDLCKAGTSILVVFGITECHAQVILRLRKIRLEGDALAIGSNSLLQFALVVEFATTLEMKRRSLRQLFLGG